MRSAVRTPEVSVQAGDGRAGTGRPRVEIRRVDPWSVLKVSFVFYLVLMLVFNLGVLMLYWALGVAGVLDGITDWFSTVWAPDFEIHAFWLFSRLFVIGLGGVVVWSLVNLFLAVLYNLVSNIFGGISVTLGEKR